MKKSLALIILFSFALQGCTVALIGAAGAGGYYLANKDDGEAGEYTNDSLNTTKIKSKYLTNSKIDSFDISVSSNNGVVSLTGEVRSNAMRQRAISIAKNTSGVKSVNASNLTVEKQT